MSRLIHLNGPSGVGKSTLARMYADRHPGVLDLDTDQVVCLIGGWRDSFWQTLGAARRIAVAMAGAHLAAGHDVVMPQLVTGPGEVEGFEAVARDCGAEYREVVLMAGREQSVRRFERRSAGGELAWHRHINEIVERAGGRKLLERIHGQLGEYLQGRPGHVVVDTDDRDPEQTYAALVAALG